MFCWRQQNIPHSAWERKRYPSPQGIKTKPKILNRIGSTELFVNLFRATQTDDKLRREKITGKTEANKTHYIVGKTVRKTIQELGGTMPKDLPTPEKSIQQIEQEQKRELDSPKGTNPIGGDGE